MPHSMAVKIAVNPTRAGELWVSTSLGIVHSLDFGVMLGGLPGVTEAWALALGAPASKAIGSSGDGRVPALYAAAPNAGKTAVWYTDDNRANWEQISGGAYGFGSASMVVLAADLKMYKR